MTDALELKISNPRRLYVMAHIGDRDSGKTERCGVDNSESVTLKCPVAGNGRYRALIFTNTNLSGTYRQAASLDVIKH